MAYNVTEYFDKFEAVRKAEAIAFGKQKRFTKLGYSPFLFLVEFEDLSKRNAWGVYPECTDTIILDITHFLHDSEESVTDTIVHEMCHMYVDRYHPEATHAHGREFVELMSRMGIYYDNTYNLRNHKEDERAKRPANWNLLLTLGTIRM